MTNKIAIIGCTDPRIAGLLRSVAVEAGAPTCVEIIDRGLQVALPEPCGMPVSDMDDYGKDWHVHRSRSGVRAAKRAKAKRKGKR